MKSGILFFSLVLWLFPQPTSSKRPNDFKWLGEFSILSETVTPDHWEKDPKLSFDSLGRVMVNRQLNPVTVSQYALSCFDHYRRTNDNRYRKNFLKQVSYLIDPNQYRVIDKEKVGYPYHYAFHDMKPDWYSGLAQGEAIAVLIRYYYLERDETVLPLIVKLKNFMLSPLDQNGLLAKNPEGGIWIEEYPNSKQNTHVLNGFMISIFCLYEYCKLFPDDTDAFDIYKKCLESLKNAVDNYDSGSWLSYDRGSKGSVSNWYMKAQVIEMKKLYEITADEFFKQKMIQWSTYTYHKPLNLVGCLINDTNFSSPLVQDSSGGFTYKAEMENLLKASFVDQFSGSPAVQRRSVSYVFDNTTSTFFSPMRGDTNKTKPFIEMQFTEAITADVCSVTMTRDNADMSFETIQYKEEGDGKWQKLKIKDKLSAGPRRLYYFKKMQLMGLRFTIDTMFSTKPVEIAEINLHNSNVEMLTGLVHRIFDPGNPIKGKFNLNFDYGDANEVFIFSRSARSKTEIAAAKWKFLSGKVPYTTESANDYTQFLIVLRPKSTEVSLKNFMVRTSS